jgi:hypothetical protein
VKDIAQTKFRSQSPAHHSRHRALLRTTSA